MDALKALAGQQGCAADGTAAQRNPLSQFVHQSMGGPQQARGMAGPGPQMQRPGQNNMSEVDQGFAQGMGVMQGPRGPVMAGPGAANSFVAEFEQMQARGPPGGPIMAGPRGPMARGPDAWINDFQRMKLGGPSQHNINMEAAYRNSFRHQMPRPMGQRWAGQMAARPPPTQMDRAWKQTAAPPPAAQQWAAEMAGPKEAPNAEKWAEEATKQEEVSVCVLLLLLLPFCVDDSGGFFFFWFFFCFVFRSFPPFFPPSLECAIRSFKASKQASNTTIVINTHRLFLKEANNGLFLESESRRGSDPACDRRPGGCDGS